MEEWVEEWFTDKVINVLNIYVLGLILVEHFGNQSNKKTLHPQAVKYVINTLYSYNRIDEDQRETLDSEIIEESETLEGIAELLFSCSKNPKWLQSQMTTIAAGNKIILARPKGQNNLYFGRLRSDC